MSPTIRRKGKNGKWHWYIIPLLLFIAVFGIHAYCGEISWSWEKVKPGKPRSRKFEKSVDTPNFQITKKDGLASNGVKAIAQMKNGAMVFGTGHGLSIWQNGVIKTYTGPESSPQEATIPGNSGLPGNDVKDLLVSSDGTLWIATRAGVCRIKNGEWELLKWKVSQYGKGSTDTTLRLGLCNVQKLFEAANGKIIIGSRNAGVMVVDPKTDTIKILYLNNDMNNWVTAIAEDKNGDLWLSIRGLGVLYYDWNKFQLYTDKEAWIPEHNIRSLCVDSRGAVWVGTHKGLGVRFPDGTARIFTKADILPDNTVWGLYARKNGQVWARTLRGSTVFDGKNWTYPARSANGFFEAVDGAIWVLAGRGAARNPQFDMKKANPTLGRLSKYKKRIEKQYPNVSPSEYLLRDRKDRIWTYGSDKFLRFDGKTWEDLSSVIENKFAEFVKEDSQGRIWIGTSGAGLVGYHGEKVLRYNNIPNHQASVIYDMAEDSKGVLYVGTQNGLYTLSGDNWENLTDKLLPGKFLQTYPVLVDKTDRVWFNDPNNGLFLYDGKIIKHLSAEKPLKGRTIKSMALTATDKVRVDTVKRTTSGTEQRTFLCDGQKCRPVDDLGTK